MHLLPNKSSQEITITPHYVQQIGDVIGNNKQSEIEKVRKRIPKWFNSPNQANHKILIKYLNILEGNSSVPLLELQKSCSSIGNFYMHYSAMKSFGERNHGKVFEESNKNIFLWEPVKDFILTEYHKFQNK